MPSLLSTVRKADAWVVSLSDSPDCDPSSAPSLLFILHFSWLSISDSLYFTSFRRGSVLMRWVHTAQRVGLWWNEKSPLHSVKACSTVPVCSSMRQWAQVGLYSKSPHAIRRPHSRCSITMFLKGLLSFSWQLWMLSNTINSNPMSQISSWCGLAATWRYC